MDIKVSNVYLRFMYSSCGGSVTVSAEHQDHTVDFSRPDNQCKHHK